MLYQVLGMRSSSSTNLVRRVRSCAMNAPSRVRGVIPQPCRGRSSRWDRAGRWLPRLRRRLVRPRRGGAGPTPQPPHEADPATSEPAGQSGPDPERNHQHDPGVRSARVRSGSPTVTAVVRAPARAAAAVAGLGVAGRIADRARTRRLGPGRRRRCRLRMMLDGNRRGGWAGRAPGRPAGRGRGRRGRRV